MATRVLGPTGSRRRRRFLLVSLLLVACSALFLAGSALAVHDETFQLDGNTVVDSATHIGTGTQAFDWNSFFDASGNPLQSSFPDASVPDYTASGFHVDFNTTNNGTKYDTSDGSTFTQGSKDQNNISSNWVCAPANNVTDKGDIQNAYAAAYTDPNTGDQFLYFGLERNSNNGDANVAFWFLQDPNANCSTAGGTTNAWTGNHQDGDILVVSAFTKGGNVSTITAYRWTGGANGGIDPTPVASGADCRAQNQPTGDVACAAANTANITTKWLTDNNGKTTGLGHTLLTGEFYEGGLNLTDSGLAGKCFNTFVGDTRSSQQLTATLYDYARGSLGECKSKTTTTPTPAAGTSTEIPASAQVTSSDSAKIEVSGVPKFSGTVKFFICGPSVGANANCQTGGDQVGSTQTLTDVTSPQTVTSDSVTLTEVGKYCWRAEYGGDSTRGVPPSTDPVNGTNQSECFSITPKTPNLTTCSGTYDLTLTCTPDGTVDFGNSVRDNANLTGTANEQGSGGIGSDGSINPNAGNGPAQGTITFKLYGPDAAGSTTNCNTLARGFATAHPNGIVVNVNGDGIYDSASYTPLDPGVYHWKASYSGDSPNTNSADTNSGCTDSNEDVTVRQIPTSISTAQKVFPEDSATLQSSISGNALPAGGTVIFRLYQATSGGNTALQNCQAHTDVLNSAGLIYKETQTTVGGVNPETLTTSNTSVSVNANGTYYWRVTYAPGDTTHTGRQSDCVENTVLTFTNDPVPGTLFP